MMCEKKMVIKVLRILTLVMAFAAFGFGAAQADQLNDILNRGEIKIGVPENFPPFGSVGKSMQHEGYDVDVAGLIAKDLAVKLKLMPLTSKQRIPYLASGKVDLVISSMGANPSRAKSIWFSAAYAPFYSGGFAPKNMKIASPADLSGKKVGLTGGTLEDLELSKVAPKDANIVRFGDNAATTSAYISGQVDVLVTGNTVAAQMAKENANLDIETKFIIKESPCFIGVKSGEMNLLQWVNVFIMHKRLGGELDELSRKWFGQALPPLPTF